jgi:hypothetical protein
MLVLILNQKFRNVFHKRHCSATKSSASARKWYTSVETVIITDEFRFLWRVETVALAVRISETLLSVNTPIVTNVSRSRAPISGATDSSATEERRTRSGDISHNVTVDVARQVYGAAVARNSDRQGL